MGPPYVYRLRVSIWFGFRSLRDGSSGLRDILTKERHAHASQLVAIGSLSPDLYSNLPDPWEDLEIRSPI